MPTPRLPLGQAYTQGIIEQLLEVAAEAGPGIEGRRAAIDFIYEHYPSLTFRSRQSVLAQFETARGEEATPNVPLGNPQDVIRTQRRFIREQGQATVPGIVITTYTIRVPITFRNKRGQVYTKEEIFQFDTARDLTDEEILEEILRKITQMQLGRMNTESPQVEMDEEYEYEIVGTSTRIGTIEEPPF